MLFTARGGQHAAFFPMDPVTIYLQRLKGRPVRVFTGFLDETPYIELYPGVIEFSASCTLKKLLYSYFDPALPYTQNFLAEYGWYPNGQGSVYNPQAINGIESDRDGGMGALLYATMEHIGHWNKKNIKIEALPDDLIARMGNMLRTFEEDNREARKELETMIRRFVGSGDYGQSGGVTGNVDVSGYEGEVPEVIYQVGKAMRVSVKYMLAAFETGIVESDMKNLTYGDADSQGWRQERMSIYGNHPYGPPTDPAAGAKRFFEECKQFDKGDGQTAGQLAADVQRPAAQYRGRYEEVRAQAIALMEKTKERVDSKDREESGGGERDRRNSDRTTRTGENTRLDAMVAEANRLHDLSMGGMRYSNFRPPNDTVGYDCSSSVGQLLKTAGYKVDGWPATSTIKAFMKKGEDPTGRLTFWNNDKNNTAGNSVHIFATIKGRDWGTNRQTSSGGGPTWHTHTKVGYEPFHVPDMDEPADIPTNANTSVPGASSPADSSSGVTDGLLSRANATILATSPNMGLDWATAEEQTEAIALQGNKSLMNDKPLLPFIQQMAEASMRQFMSMPNGDFFAFYPDYFGETWHRPPYWIIDDIEVLDGKVRLSDAALVTHEYALGDTSFQGVGSLTSKLFSVGVVSLMNAFQSELVTTQTDRTANDPDSNRATRKLYHAFNRIMKQEEAVQFLERYGARPDVQEFPFIRNPFFELFMAYQRFMQAWARQFLSPFKLTFMPELYPGGKVGFPEHGLQMYVEEVTHTWDYTGGFVTEAELSSPAAMLNDKGVPASDNLPPNMPTALLEASNDGGRNKGSRNPAPLGRPGNADDGDGQQRPT